MREEKRQHLEFVQNVITRMNTNSFQIKGFAVTIVTGFLAVYAARPDVKFIFLAIAPAFVFWLLDGYYLQQERKFRGLYNDIVKVESNIELYSMPIQNYCGGKYGYFQVLFSKTIIWVYLFIMVGLLIAGIIILKWYS